MPLQIRFNIYSIIYMRSRARGADKMEEIRWRNGDGLRLRKGLVSLSNVSCERIKHDC